jgi:hypothetical protein
MLTSNGLAAREAEEIELVTSELIMQAAENHHITKLGRGSLLVARVMKALGCDSMFVNLLQILFLTWSVAPLKPFKIIDGEVERMKLKLIL